MEQRKPSQLSGGQRQRVALARAIVCQPKVLLLDEPLSALDAKLRHLMQVELKRLQKKLGITFIFVTHDQEEALTMSDRIAVVNKGRIEQLGPSSEIYHSPEDQLCRELHWPGKHHRSRHRSPAKAASRGSDSRPMSRCSVPADNVPAGSTQLLVSIRPEKIHLQKTKPNGENVFAATVDEELFKGAIGELRSRRPVVWNSA